MVYPSQWRRIEQEYDEPMETLLPRIATELGSLSAVAKLWNVSGITVWTWAEEIGLVREVKFVVKKPHKPPAIRRKSHESRRK